mgnify:CR=1 FL=1
MVRQPDRSDCQTKKGGTIGGVGIKKRVMYRYGGTVRGGFWGLPWHVLCVGFSGSPEDCTQLLEVAFMPCHGVSLNRHLCPRLICYCNLPVTFR